MTALPYEVKKATYTKENGEVSDREVIILTTASDCHMCLDVSKLDDHAKQGLSGFLQKQKVERDAKIKELGAQFKQFKKHGFVFKE